VAKTVEGERRMNMILNSADEHLFWAKCVFFFAIFKIYDNIRVNQYLHVIKVI